MDSQLHIPILREIEGSADEHDRQGEEWARTLSGMVEFVVPLAPRFIRFHRKDKSNPRVKYQHTDLYVLMRVHSPGFKETREDYIGDNYPPSIVQETYDHQHVLNYFKAPFESMGGVTWDKLIRSLIPLFWLFDRDDDEYQWLNDNPLYSSR